MRFIIAIRGFFGRHPVIWILMAVVCGAIAVGLLVALLDPVSEWGNLGPTGRTSLAGALVGFLGLLAAVFALVYALAQVRQVFPRQLIVIETYRVLDDPPNPNPQGARSAFLTIRFNVPETSPIVNAYRISVQLYVGDDPVVKAGRNHIGFIDLDSEFTSHQSGADPEWIESHSFMTWTTESERRWFPGVTIHGPVLIGQVRPESLEELRAELNWRGSWWTDREGPVDFQTPI